MKKLIIILSSISLLSLSYNISATGEELGAWLCKFNDWLPQEALYECNEMIDPGDSLFCCEENIKNHLITKHGIAESLFVENEVYINGEFLPLFRFVQEVSKEKLQELHAHFLMTTDLEINNILTLDHYQYFNEGGREPSILQAKKSEKRRKKFSTPLGRKKEKASKNVSIIYVCKEHDKRYITPNAMNSLRDHLRFCHGTYSINMANRFKRYWCNKCIVKKDFQSLIECQEHIKSAHYNASK